MYSFSAGSCTAFLVSHLIRWLLNSNFRKGSHELQSAAPCLVGLVIALLPDQYGFGSCVGLHLCVYAFMLVQACRSILKAGPLELAQVSLAVTWPSGLVCMIGSQHLEHGAVQTAVAITLLTTAAGQTTLLSPGNEGLCKAFRILRPAILVLTLVLMTTFTVSVNQSQYTVLPAALLPQGEEDHLEHFQRFGLTTQICLVLAAGISTITLGGLTLIASEPADGTALDDLRSLDPCTFSAERRACAVGNASQATRHRSGPHAVVHKVTGSALNSPLTCDRTLSCWARTAPAKTCNGPQNPVLLQPLQGCNWRAAVPNPKHPRPGVRPSITLQTPKAGVLGAMKVPPLSAGYQGRPQEARLEDFQFVTVRAPGSFSTSTRPIDGHEFAEQPSSRSHVSIAASNLHISVPQSVAGPAAPLSERGKIKQAPVWPSVKTAAPQQDVHTVEPKAQDHRMFAAKATLQIPVAADADIMLPPLSHLSLGSQTPRVHARLRGAASEGLDGASVSYESPATPRPQPWVHLQLQGLLLTLRQSASTLAHDMRNPLTLVLAMSDLLRKKEDLPADVIHNCSIIHTCAHHMLMMISAMRDNLWLMTGKLDLMPTQAQVLPLVQDALENLHGLVRQRVHVQIDVPADSLCCMDLDRLKHAIHIPLANAIKYTKRGTVKISSREEGDFLMLSFSNNGVAPNIQTLEAFSLDAGVPAASDPHSRMRCGLRFVTQILRESGGSVSLQRNGDGHSDGCTVTLMLPRMASTRPSEPMLILPDGTSSLQDLTPEQANAALDNSNSMVSAVSPKSAPETLADDLPHRSTSRSLGIVDARPPNGDPQTQYRREAFPHGPVHPELAQDIDKMIEQTSKDAAGPTTTEERADHLKRYFQLGSSEAPLRDALRLVEEHGIPVYNPSDHTILIVDDDETNVHVLESLLFGEGYRTMSALSGFQALELFAQAMPKPSCVLLDIGLPDISGEEVCSKLLQMSAHMPVPIIIVSQRKELKDIIGGLRRGAVDYIRKPFESEEVLARLGTILRFHMMDLQQRRASAKQILEMMRLVFPQHIVDLATTGHRVMAENISCAVVLSIHIHGFRTMSSSVPMVTAVSKVSSLLSMISTEILSHGIEQVDMAHDKYVACAIAEDSGQIPEKVTAVIKASEVIFSKCEAMQAGNTLRLQLCAGLHAGPAVAAMVGLQRPKWVMFGEAPGIAASLRKAAVPSSILLSSDVEKFLQAHSPPLTCIHCVPVMLNGYGMVRPYTLPFGAYRTVMHGHYHHVTNQDKERRAYAAGTLLDRASNTSAPPQPSPVPRAVTTIADRPVAGHTDAQHSNVSLDQWLTQLGLGHYRPMLAGLTISQVLNMDSHMLQEAGVITTSAIRRILHAKEIAKRLR